MSGSNKNNSWLFVLLAGLLGYGVGKTIEKISDRNTVIRQLSEAIVKMRGQGLSDDQILQACYEDASRKLSKELNDDERDRVKDAFIKAKNLIKA